MKTWCKNHNVNFESVVFVNQDIFQPLHLNFHQREQQILKPIRAHLTLKRF